MLMISKPKTTEKVVAKFFIKNLPIISGETYYKSLNEMIQVLYYNAATLSTTIAIRRQGNVSPIMKDTLYDTLVIGTPWEETDNPGSIPPIATNYTVALHHQANKIYGKARQIFENANHRTRCR